MLSPAVLAYRLNEFQILCFFCNHLLAQPEPPGTAAGARGGGSVPVPPHVSDPETFCFQSRNILFTRQKLHGKTGVNRTLQDRGTDTHPPVCCRATSGNNNCSCRGDRPQNLLSHATCAFLSKAVFVRNMAGHTPGMRTPEVWQSSACSTSTSLRRQFRSRSGAGG